MPINYSETTNNYRKKLNEMETNQPSEYQSQYGGQISDLLDRITNREAFSYDFNADPLYQQYKDHYYKAGKEASMNAVANTSAMTGGYANSYSATAAAQANQEYLSHLNDKIPELYSAAMDKYKMEGEQMKDNYAVLSDADNTAYGRYRDNVSDYYTNRDYYQNSYSTSVGQDQWNANYDYQIERDKVADEQWQKEFDENVRQFGLTYAIQQAELQLEQEKWAYEKAMAAASSGGGGGGGGRSGSGGSSGSSGSSSSNNFRTGNMQANQSGRYAQTSTHSGWETSGNYNIKKK